MMDENTARNVASETEQSPGGQPSEAELRAALAAELKQIKVSDLLLQTAVSLLNIAAVRLGLVGAEAEQGIGDSDSGIDLVQAKEAIDALRAVLPLLENADVEVKPLRDGLSNLQMAYVARSGGGVAQEHGGAATADDSGVSPTPNPATSQKTGSGSKAGPAEASGRLWVPGR